MSPRSSSIRISAFLLSLCVSGCSTVAVLTHRFEFPRIRLADSKVESLTPTAVVIHLGLQVANPNRFALAVQTIRYSLRAGVAELAHGVATHKQQFKRATVGMSPSRSRCSSIRCVLPPHTR